MTRTRYDREWWARGGGTATPPGGAWTRAKKWWRLGCSWRGHKPLLRHSPRATEPLGWESWRGAQGQTPRESNSQAFAPTSPALMEGLLQPCSSAQGFKTAWALCLCPELHNVIAPHLELSINDIRKQAAFLLVRTSRCLNKARHHNQAQRTTPSPCHHGGSRAQWCRQKRVPWLSEDSRQTLGASRPTKSKRRNA